MASGVVFHTVSDVGAGGCACEAGTLASGVATGQTRAAERAAESFAENYQRHAGPRGVDSVREARQLIHSRDNYALAFLASNRSVETIRGLIPVQN